MSANKHSVRSKINSHFGGGSSTKKQYALSKDIEDPVDIYNHTKQFFKKNAEDEIEYDKVDIGEKKIRTHI
jgi:hypothetical protein